MGKDISAFTNLLASVQRFHSVLNNPGIKPTLIQGCTISHQNNVGTPSFLTSFQLLSVVLWGLLERSITKSPIKKKKRQHSRKTLQEETSLQVWPLRALQKAPLCCWRKKPMKYHCQSELSSQSSSLTLPLESKVNLECQAHHSGIFAMEHLQIFSLML